MLPPESLLADARDDSKFGGGSAHEHTATVPGGDQVAKVAHCTLLTKAGGLPPAIVCPSALGLLSLYCVQPYVSLGRTVLITASVMKSCTAE